jgi:hypothetical protein
MKFLLVLLFFIIIHGFKFKHFLLNKYTNKVFKNSKLITCNNNCDIFIILFPGYGKNPNSYYELCSKIQEKTQEKNINVNFLLIDYLFNIPLNGDKQSKLISNDCKDYLKQQNLTYNSLYFMGHSAGAYHTMSLANKMSNGFIQLGNVLNSGNKLPWDSINISDYNIPVLTLLAQKDGLTNPFLADYELANINDTINNDKSVVIEKNVDHYQMSDGNVGLSSMFLDKNIFSNIPLDEAQDKITDTISNFLTWPYNKTSYDKLHEKLNETKKTILEYRLLSREINSMVRNIQYSALNTDFYHPFSIIVDEVENALDFLTSRAELKDNGTFIVKYHLENICNPFSPLLSKQCSIKLKGQPALLQHPKYRHLNVYRPTTAKEINKNLIDKQLKNKNIKNANIVYLDDKECSDKTGTLDWLKDSVNITFVNHEKTLYIQSPVFKTLDYPIKEYSNLYYMKVLTPQLAYEIVSLYF